MHENNKNGMERERVAENGHMSAVGHKGGKFEKRYFKSYRQF